MKEQSFQLSLTGKEGLREVCRFSNSVDQRLLFLRKEGVDKGCFQISWKDCRNRTHFESKCRRRKKTSR